MKRRRPTPGGVQDVLLMHEAFLADRRRQRAFRQALARTVRVGDAVLDIGAGTGVWAIEAARLGAREVVAIEREPVLVPVIERLARENGVADRVRVVAGDSRHIHLPRRFDVVVAELVGHQGFDEEIVPVLADARARFLRPGGRIVPRALALLAAPARLRGMAAVRGAGLRLAAFRELTVHCPRVMPAAALLSLTAPVRLVSVDLRTAPAKAGAGALDGAWTVDDIGRVDGIAVWVEVTLAPGVVLSTRAGTHWSPTFLPVDDLGSGPGRLRCRVRLADRPASWEVQVSTRGGDRVWSHSPLFAYGSLVSAIRRGGRRGTAIRSAG